MSQIFQSRLEDTGIKEVANVLQIEHPEAEAMVAAEGVVAKRLSELDKEMFTPFYAEDLVELGRKVAAGELKPKTVADRVASVATRPGADGVSRRDLVLKGVRQCLVAAEDRPEWSKKELLKSFVPVVQERIEGYIEELQAALADAPDHVRKPMVDGYGIGILHTGEVELESLSSSDFAAYKRIKDVLSIAEPAGNENQFVNVFKFSDGEDRMDLEVIALRLGSVPGDRYQWNGELKPGAHPGFNQDLLWSDDAELLGAGYRLIDGVRGRNGITFAPIVDPEGVHADIYADRLKRFNKVYDWRHEFEAMKIAGASLSRGDWAHLRWRRDLEPAKVLEVMKRDGKL